ncbi:type VI secretion system tube protein TssD [Aquimarina algiphila]|uniref:type VI secretion system tube protein TssD n=1 Tax=Aquimarina algiphila TaxID=2047982 RepID=UPI00232ABE6E|nr:type VI secretion system tube protein TssD [Aquimarina algiphila]
MSFLAKLKIDNIEYNVLKARYSIHQSDDETGLPNERPTAGKLFLTVESNKSTDAISWAMSNKMLKDGTLTFYNRDAISTFRKIEFKDAYCLKFEEIFHSSNTDPLLSELIISAKELIIKDVSHTNPWTSL